MLIYFSFLQWLDKHLLTCPSKKFLHIDCPGCGLQRSVLRLLEGRLGESLQLYPATMPLMVLGLYAALHLKFHFAQGALVIKILQGLVGIIILVFYIYKVVTLKIIN